MSQENSHYREGAQQPGEKMTHPVDVSQPLSSATSVLAQYGQELSGYDDKDGGYAWAQQDGFPLIKADLVITFAKCLESQ